VSEFSESRWTFLRGLPPELSTALTSLRHPWSSFTGKLLALMLLTTTVALLVAGVALLATEVYQNRRAQGQELQSTASILALATAPALSFDDRKSAARDLGALSALPAVRSVGLYDAGGRLFAQFRRRGAAAPPQLLQQMQAGVHFSGDDAWLVQPVMQSDERLGTILLHAHYDLLAPVTTYAGVLGAVILLGLLAAFLAAARLHRVITLPMSSITEVARQIVRGHSFSLRARKTTQDEFGLVVDAFNNMLDGLQGRTEALEESNAALQEADLVRRAAEQALRESERLYRAIGETINYGIWVCDAQGRNSYASECFLSLVGMTLEQYCDPGWACILHPEDRAAVLEAWRECIRTGNNFYHEHRIRSADGQYRPILAHGVPIRNDAGIIQRWAGIHLDISRLKMTEQALREADRRKDEFLATLAHELRNPLAPIRNALFILNSSGASAGQRQRARELMERQVGHMAVLLDDLLDVARVTHGQFALKRETTELRSIFDAAVETARPLLEAKKHEFSVRLPPWPVMLDADPVRLAQVISNLLTNAAKYTDSGGRIQLLAELRDSDLLISVTDDGIGLAPESIDSLFRIFSQVDSSLDRAQGGLGIGLALVKGLVELHGGKVEAHSAGIGHGSKFVVRLPATLLVESPLPALNAAASAAARIDGTGGATVLVADDNRDAAETLSVALELEGYRVLTAFTGPQALELGREHRPRAIILDIGMPGMNGYETIGRLRREEWGRKTFAIALTGWGQEQDKAAAFEAGFDYHLTKPVDVETLLGLLRESLSDVPAGLMRAPAERISSAS
jgi:PAS domain S-box-containing protein